MVKEVILKVGTNEAVKNVGELRENIKQLKQALNDKDISTPEGMKEYNETLQELKVNQNALKDAMYATTASWEDVTNAATGANIAFRENNELVSMAGVSYNALVHELADLKQAWRATTDEAERAQLAEKINAVNNQLKTMDASVGNYQRNVGNYIGAVDHLTASFGAFGKGAQAVVNPIKGATGALKAMSATPVIGILGVLVSILSKIIDAMKSSEEGTNAMTAAMAPFSAISQAVTDILEVLGGVVAKLVGGFGKLAAAIFGANKASKERLEIAKQEAELAQQQRETIVKNAEAEREVARLRAEASDKSNTSAKERIALLEEAGRLEGDIAKRALEDAQLQYQIIKRRNALNKSNKEELDAEAKAYADMVKAETNYYNQIRTINSGLTRARREEAKEARETAKAVKDAAVAKINSEKEYLTQLLTIVRDGSDSQFKIQNTIAKKEYEAAVANAKEKISDQKELARTLEMLEKSFQVKLQKNRREHEDKMLAEELQAITNRRDAFRKGSVEYLAVQEEFAQKEYDSLRKRMDETQAQYDARKLAAQRALKEAQDAVQSAIITEGAQQLENEMAALRQGSVEQFAKAVELAKYNLDNLYQAIDETDDAFLARRLEAQEAYEYAVGDLQQAEIDNGRLQYELRLASLNEESLEYLAAEVELKQYELDTLHQLEEESEEEFQLRMLEANKAYTEAKKKQLMSYISLLQTAAGGISSIMGSIADAMESNTEASKEEQEKAKNLRIAGATIDMLSGVVTAVSTAMQLGPIAGPIMAAINSASVIAAGVTNISKIKAQKIDTNSSSSQSAQAPSVVQAPTVEPVMQSVRTITSASEEDRLDRIAADQRVYILSSDLEADRNATRARVEETSF